MKLLSVTEGSLALEIDGVDHLIAASHRAIAMTDRPHVYRCHGKKGPALRWWCTSQGKSKAAENSGYLTDFSASCMN